MLIPTRTPKGTEQATLRHGARKSNRQGKLLGMADTPDLVVLPFKATIFETGQRLTFGQVIAIRNSEQVQSLRIERSYPGAPEAIGWTVFERTSRAYSYKNEPLFLYEKAARRHIRKVYAIRQDLSDDILSTSNLHI